MSGRGSVDAPYGITGAHLWPTCACVTATLQIPCPARVRRKLVSTLASLFDKRCWRVRIALPLEPSASTVRHWMRSWLTPDCSFCALPRQSHQLDQNSSLKTHLPGGFSPSRICFPHAKHRLTEWSRISTTRPGQVSLSVNSLGQFYGNRKKKYYLYAHRASNHRQRRWTRYELSRKIWPMTFGSPSQ